MSSLLLRSAARGMASWACTRCTFLNSPTQKSACAICLSPAAASSPPPSPIISFRHWSCRACTFANPLGTRACDVCGTRAVAPFDDLALDQDDLSDPAIHSVFRPLQRCSTHAAEVDPPKEKTDAAEVDPPSRKEDVAGSAFQPLQPCSSKRGRADNVANSHTGKMPRKEKVPSTVAGNVDPTLKKDMLKILSYNVWFREDLEVHRRMIALGDLIQEHNPDIICFQEVTPNIYEIFQKSNWWEAYTCSVSLGMSTERPYFCMQMSKLPVKAFTCKPFSNSIMGRELSLADIDAGIGKMLVVATSHLESPCPAPPRWDQMYSKERVAQAKESIGLLGDLPNAIFCGDVNWDDKLDGAFPLPDGWVDAWLELRPAEDGWTYDTKANQMLSGNRKLQKRLDRCICKLRDFRVSSIQMIGMEAIPGLSYCKEKKVRNEYKKLVLPVFPSDHFGLLLTICS